MDSFADSFCDGSVDDLDLMNPSLDFAWPENNSGRITSLAADLTSGEDSAALGPSPDVIAAMLANEMANLSVQERMKAEDDVHGVLRSDQVETAEVLQRCASQLDSHLQTIRRGTALELAEAMDRVYTSSWALKTMFIRAERYRPVEAAERLVRFFELKKELFGTKLLTTDILLEHLNPDDMEALRSGGLQICPVKDVAGRPIISIMLAIRKYKAAENMQRACFYVYMSLADDQSAQLSGIVNVSYAVGGPKFKSVQVQLRKAIPLHIACQHFAYDDPTAYTNASYGIANLNKVHRVRFRTHVGSHVECLYALATYGIPLDALPVNSEGEISNKHHHLWIQKQEEAESLRRIRPQETTSASFGGFSASLSPTENVSSGVISSHTSAPDPPSAATVESSVTVRRQDILFGRGKTVGDHMGNVWFRQLVDAIMVQYEAGTRMEKATIAEMIVNFVKSSGGRFLKIKDEANCGAVSDNCWEEVEDHFARKKVAHTFRNRRKYFVPSSEATTA